jgi:hypothetical protein
MSKAEDRYLECFQDGRARNCSSKEAFLLGYYQAEKDFELTWEDVRDILNLYEEVIEMDFCEDDYGEVLKRFKERKEK